MSVRVGESWPVPHRPGRRRWVSVGFPLPLALVIGAVWALGWYMWAFIALYIWLAAEATLLVVSALTCLITMIIWHIHPRYLLISRVTNPPWLWRWHLYFVDLRL